jgi:hypothetical protein
MIPFLRLTTTSALILEQVSVLVPVERRNRATIGEELVLGVTRKKSRIHESPRKLEIHFSYVLLMVTVATLPPRG